MRNVTVPAGQTRTIRESIRWARVRDFGAGAAWAFDDGAISLPVRFFDAQLAPSGGHFSRVDVTGPVSVELGGLHDTFPGMPAATRIPPSALAPVYGTPTGTSVGAIPDLGVACVFDVSAGYDRLQLVCSTEYGNPAAGDALTFAIASCDDAQGISGLSEIARATVTTPSGAWGPQDRARFDIGPGCTFPASLLSPFLAVLVGNAMGHAVGFKVANLAARAA